MRGPGGLALLLALALGGGEAATPDQEDLFLQTPDAEAAFESLKHYASIPHVHGSPGDHELALWTQKRLTELLGLNATIQEVNVGLAWPDLNNRPSLELNTSDGTLFRAKLAEAVLDEDNTSDTLYRNLTWSGYSVPGKVSGRIVYANYGRLEDFELLAQSNVSVKGAIALVRLGHGMWRGLQVANAEAHGAIACVLFSDPQEDGYGRGEVYPHGPWRPASSVQRGSIAQMQLCPGDPTRAYLGPGMADSQCGLKAEELIPKIPALPISYEDAEPLLRELQHKGPAPTTFQGGLKNITYHTGPSESEANLHVTTDNHKGPIWNVIAIIPGRLEHSVYDRPIVLGNHRDAWVYGAVDANSGSAALLEVAKGLGEMLKTGWKPLRTIILASWDGEEAGCLGSTAYAELEQRGILMNAAAYINVDAGVSGKKFKVQASPALQRFVMSIAENIVDPETDLALSQVWDRKVAPLGAGSDYSAFIDHLGISSVDLSFTGDYGVYHSVYDSVHWFETNCDKRYLAVLAKFWGLMAIRLADALVLQHRPDSISTAIGGYMTELSQLNLKDSKPCPVVETVLKAQKTFDLRTELLYAEASRVADQLFMEVATEGLEPIFIVTRSYVSNLNDRLALTERKFLGDGLPNRPWFRHVLQAPDLVTGYSAQTLPGPTEAIKRTPPDCGDFATQLTRVAVQLYEASSFLIAPPTPAPPRPPTPTPAPPPRPPGPGPYPRKHGSSVLKWFVAILGVFAVGGLCVRKVNAREAQFQEEYRRGLADGGGHQLQRTTVTPTPH